MIPRSHYILQCLQEAEGRGGPRFKEWFNIETGERYAFSAGDAHAMNNPETKTRGRNVIAYRQLFENGWVATYYMFGEAGATILGTSRENLTKLREYFLNAGVPSTAPCIVADIDDDNPRTIQTTVGRLGRRGGGGGISRFRFRRED